MRSTSGIANRLGARRVGNPKDRKFELPKAALSALTKPKKDETRMVTRKPRAADDDGDDKQRREDERLRRLEDGGRDTGEDEDEKKARHARERKRAKAEDDDQDGDDDSDREDEDDPAMRRARARERGRVTAIMISGAARRHPVLAMHVAAMTNMPRSAAIKFVDELGALSADQTSSPQTLAEQIILAGRRARGEVPTPFSLPTQERRHAASAAEIIAAGRKRRGEI